MKNILRVFLLALIPILYSCGGQEQKKIYEEKPSEAKPVYDFAGILNENEEYHLTNKLLDYYDSTSTQVVIITVNYEDLQGDDIQTFATEIGHKWGVGQKDEDNGVVIAIQPKTEDANGNAFIATGYGMEGLIPDITAGEIVENEMIPSFKEGNYFAGLNKATDVIVQLGNGEYTARQYSQRARQQQARQKKEESSPLAIIIPILIFFLIFGGIFGRANRARRGSIGRNIPLFILLSMLGSGSRHGGSYGNFSSGSGGFGGGGFGGGGFGGGGAGGSW